MFAAVFSFGRGLHCDR